MNTVLTPQNLVNPSENHLPASNTVTRLQDLIPIAMVIVGGCESCAEKMVERALREGSSHEDIDKTLRIVAGMQKFDCFAKAVGPEVVSRMDRPIEAGRRTLENAKHSAPGCCSNG